MLLADISALAIRRLLPRTAILGLLPISYRVCMDPSNGQKTDSSMKQLLIDGRNRREFGMLELE